jgi:hypothetical protein
MRFAVCLSPADAHSLGIPDRAMRSIDVASARNDKDRAARAAKRRRILKDVYKINKIPSGVLPGFGPQDDMDRTRLMIVSPIATLKRFGDKLARGLTCAIFQQLIDNEYEVETHLPVNEGLCDFDLLLVKHGTTHYKGPGILVSSATVADDKRGHLYGYVIWGRLRLYSIVARVGALGA